jgi:dTDP-4-amino-4,6-dideoxygalactose transaminase
MNPRAEATIAVPLFPELVQPSEVAVARSIAPDRDLFIAQLDRMAESRRYSNFGPLHETLQNSLCAYLDAPHVGLFANATSALTIAMRALGVAGEVITTPFSFAASAHSILWAGATPVFVDIDPLSLTLDPAMIEAAITPKTTAILAVHIYGRPCDVVALQDIASRHGLRLIFDAAHAFDTRIDGQPIHSFGDATIYSTHASKLFHTGEGGLIVTHNAALHERCVQLSNFGFNQAGEIAAMGSNGKMSELHAATGLAVLPLVALERRARTALRTRYQRQLAALDRIRVFDLPASVSDSLQYFVIRINAAGWPDIETPRNFFHECLNKHGVCSRKYFYPLCNEFLYNPISTRHEGNKTLVAHNAAEEVLCLPFHGGVTDRTVDAIAELARRTLCANQRTP